MKHTLALILSLLFLFSCSRKIQEELPTLTYQGENPRIQNPLSPEESQKHIQLPAGFTAELYAAEPNIINPIAMTWDEKGRLWVVQSMDYPHNLENEVGGDRITICEDTDGDGKADKFTDFAVNQSLTTGIVKVKDGIIVAQAPNMIFLKDENGDDTVDGKEILFGGFGIWDTHAGPSSLKYGYDNKIWGAVGYSAFENTFGGKQVKFGRGIYRFSRDGKDFEPLGQFNNNTWGLGISQDFEIFGSTANNNHACYVGIPMKYYDYLDKKPDWAINSDFIQGHYEISPVDTMPLQQVDVRGGYTAAAGANFYLANNYPKEYQNQMYVNAPTGHLVHIAKIVQKGGGFIEEDGGNIFASTDAWTAPVFAETGPDGNLWIADWYNPVIQHNPDARGMDNQIWNNNKGEGNAHLNEHRDKKHGRIYVIKHKKGKSSPIKAIHGDEDKELVKALQSNNVFWRTTAQRLIVEYEKNDLRQDLIELAKKKEKNNHGVAAHALFTLHGLEAFDDNDTEIMDALRTVLQDGSIASRTAALDLLPRSEVGSEILLQSGLLKDNYLPLRKKAILKASELPETSEIFAIIEQYLNSNDAHDKWIAAALNVYMKVKNHETVAKNEVEMIIPSAEDASISWQYTTKDPGENWHQTTFDDSQWLKSNGALGTPKLNSRIKTTWEEKEIWIRRELELESTLSDPVLKILHDDDYEVYVNGELLSKSSGSNGFYELIKLDQELSSLFKKGTNVIAAHCIDTGGDQAIDVGFGNLKGFQADRIFNINTVPQKMAFDDTILHAMAGEKIEIRLNNIDEMPHNMVVIQKGSLQSFGKIVDQFLTDPKAAESEYLPKSRYILGATEMLDPEESGVIRFTVPNQSGIYPFICTFPGHWRVMQGELVVSSRGTYVNEDPSAPSVAVMGGGGSHDFQEYFGAWDGKIWSEGGRNVFYTEQSDELRNLMSDAELLVISNNKAFASETQKAIFQHVEEGKPMAIFHPSAWYNWKDWPEYNRILVGGGSKSHEKLQEFEVRVVKPNHPLMKDVPKTFRITDELYRFEKDPQGSAVEVLAMGRGLESGEEYPVVWVVKRPTSKVVVNTLGHDEDAHGLEAYQTILRNTANWLLPIENRKKQI